VRLSCVINDVIRMSVNTSLLGLNRSLLSVNKRFIVRVLVYRVCGYICVRVLCACVLVCVSLSLSLSLFLSLSLSLLLSP